MGSITQLRQDIQFTQQLGNLLDVLKSIAAQQFQALERALRVNVPFFTAVQTIAGTLDLEHFAHPFTQAEGPRGVIAVTSDTGFLGGLNQQVIAAAAQEYRRQPGELMVVGRRGLSYVEERGLSARVFPGIQEMGRHALAAEVRAYALDQALEGRVGTLSIVYPRALTFTVQRVEVVRLLPCQEWLHGLEPTQAPHGGPIVLESTRRDLLEYLVWIWMGEKLVEVFGHSRLAELAARSVHLEGSSQELQQRVRKFRMRYFRRRRELIDANMRELFAARSLFGESSYAQSTDHSPQSTAEYNS